MKKIQIATCFLLLTAVLAGCGKKAPAVTETAAAETTAAETVQETAPETAAEISCTFDGTVLHYNGKDYDIAERDDNVNSINACTVVGNHIVVEGHVNPKNNIYSIFNTGTETFEKDITGTNLTWRDDDIATAVYSSGPEILSYDGSVIAVVELADKEFVSGIAFVGDNIRLEVSIESGEESETKTTEVSLPSE